MNTNSGVTVLSTDEVEVVSGGFWPVVLIIAAAASAKPIEGFVDGLFEGFTDKK